MILFPNCKINLGLHVVSRRSDGFHDIETVFYPVPWGDVLEIVPDPGKDCVSEYSGLPIPGDPGVNLIVKAYRLMKTEHGIGGIRTHLHKIIPMGSGLGGGSSDAASALRMLNELFSLQLDHDPLMNYARQLGSDCSFFIRNRPCFATGKGDQIEPLELDLAGYWLVIAVPEVMVNTAEAYGMITPRPPDHPLKESILAPVETWNGLLVNDFEIPVLAKYPVIRKVKEELLRAGALYASMSGSGSSVYGIFGAKPEGVGISGCKQFITAL